MHIDVDSRSLFGVTMFDFSTSAAIVLIARLCLGFIFLSSALGKLTNRRSFIQGIVDYQVFPRRVAQSFGLVLPWIEVGVAFALILGIVLPLAGIVTALLLLGFTVGVTTNLRRGRQLDCHCYGIASPRTISWGIVVRNVLLLLLAAVVIGFTVGVKELNQWSTLWQVDRQIILSSTIIPLSLLLAFCFATIHLLEWTVDIRNRIS